MIADNSFGASILTNDAGDSASLYLNLFTLVSYPVNFFIYCAMSQQFRRTFCELFTRSTAGVVVTASAGSAPGVVRGSEIVAQDRLNAPLDCIELASSGVTGNRLTVPPPHRLNGRQSTEFNNDRPIN